jgi:hypothetical protein
MVRRANNVPLTLRATASGFYDYCDWHFDSRKPGLDGHVEVALRRKLPVPASAPAP